MMVHLKDGCTIAPTSFLWRQHCREDANSWNERYVGRM